MPTRTLVQELCDVCFVEDGVENESSDRLRFAWQGQDYVLLVCGAHVGPIRDELQHLSELATPEGGRRRAVVSSAPRPSGGGERRRRAAGGEAASRTLFSQLSSDEKERFRKWADLPNARRIADSRVEEWTAAGQP